MLAQHLAGRGADLTGPGRQVVAEELAEVALTDKADTGGSPSFRGGQAGFPGHGPHIRLHQFTQREHGGRQLLLAQLVQEVALVLAGSRARSRRHWLSCWSIRA